MDRERRLQRAINEVQIWSDVTILFCLFHIFRDIVSCGLAKILGKLKNDFQSDFSKLIFTLN